MTDQDNQLAIAVAHLQSALASISAQLTQIASQLVKLEDGKASAKVQYDHGNEIIDLRLALSGVKTIGKVLMVLIPIVCVILTFVFNLILKSYG